MKLTEYKSKYYHFFLDENENTQGEYKEYYSNGQLWIHCYFKDNKRHGEYKEYYSDGLLDYKKYYSNDKDITEMYNKLKVWKSL